MAKNYVKFALMDTSLEVIRERIRTKKKQYQEYAFSVDQVNAIWAFFDLAQEYATLENFYRVCVLVPKEFLACQSRLYLVEEDNKVLLVADSEEGLISPPRAVPDLSPREEAFSQNGSFFFSFKGNRKLLSLLALPQEKPLLGMLEVRPPAPLQKNDFLFFQKYANRIGYNLHIKLLMTQTLEHIKFVNELVADIEHNVIIPNMYYRYLFRGLKKKIDFIKELRENLNRPTFSPEKVAGALEHLYQELLNHYQQIEKHYETVSLFLESLLRREHFEKGRFVLRKRPCRFAKEVIEAQLERYRKRFEQAGIKIDNRLGGVPDEEFVMAVDVGLLSQVYANLFSNALKYTREVTDETGKRVKFISLGREIIPDFFGPGRPGVKFNVFSTGPHLPPEEAQKIFEEGWRGTNTQGQPGSGRGLHFVKKVIELHGGVVGYEPTPLGNNFYFILPLKVDPKEASRELTKAS